MKRVLWLMLPLALVGTACGSDGSGTPGSDAYDVEFEDGVDSSEELELGSTAQGLAAGVTVTFENQETDGGTRMCIGVDGASTAVGALLKLFRCDNAINQSWTVRRTGALHVFENVKAVGKCMGVDRGSTAAGANIAIFNCDGAANQSWVLLDGDDDLRFNVVNSRTPERCLGVSGGRPDPGAQIQQFGCNFSAPNQDWRVIIR